MLATCCVIMFSAFENAAASANRIATTGWWWDSAQSGRAHPPEVVRAHPHVAEAGGLQPRLQLGRVDRVVRVVLVEGRAALAVDPVRRHESGAGDEHTGQLGKHAVLGLG